MKARALLPGLLFAAIAAAGCATATTGAVPRPFPMPGRGGVGQPETEDASSRGRVTPPAPPSAVVRTALELRGTPYRNGGTDTVGFDCSGFTQYVFSRHHIALPREVRDQFKTGSAIPKNKIRPGDLLFFSTTEPGASHVAIAVGKGEFVHAPSSTGVVRVERLGTEYWSHRFLGARRVRG